MKLARVTHMRCGNHVDATTYVWVEDYFTEKDLEKNVEMAKVSYLAAEAAFKNDPNAPPNVGSYADYQKYPDRTVKEVDAIFLAQKTAYNAWKKKRDEARKPFAHHLVQISKGAIKNFYDVEPLSCEVDWDHRHGVTIEYGGTEPSSEDFNYKTTATFNEN
jgi:hypothetical protein